MGRNEGNLTAQQQTEHEPGSRDALLEEVRAELDAAAQDLERLNEQLRDRVVEVQRLEILVDHLLDRLTVPALVVDPDGRLAAVSRGAVDGYAQLSRDAVGRPVSTVLPEDLAEQIRKIIEARSGTAPQPLTVGSDPSDVPQDATFQLAGATAVALPDGSLLIEPDT
jgi:nitrogen fixation/metabolism regulation signal transduction histidine kinase